MRINNNNIKLALFSIIAVVLLLIIINIAIPKKEGHTNLGNDILGDVQTGQISSAGMQQLQQHIDSYKSKDVFGTIFKITNNYVLTLKNGDIASSSIITRGISQAICQIPCGVFASYADLHWDFQSIINLGQPGKYSFTIDQTSGIKYTYDTVSNALRVVIGSIEYHDNGSALNYKTYCHCDFAGRRSSKAPAYYSVPLNDLKITLTNIVLDCTMLSDATGTTTSITINNINVGGLRVFDDVISGLTAVFGFGYDFAQLIGDNIIKPVVNSNLPKNIPLSPKAMALFMLILSL
jgi:hypothetical protein